jgi:probable phosphoglycerate mutase
MIYFVRHGLDDEKYIGGYSQAGLIDEGIQQMNVTAAWLLKNVSNINSIYSSDINRAIQSANIINGYLKKEVFIISYLRELNKGVLNGCLKEIAKVKYPEYMDVTIS